MADAYSNDRYLPAEKRYYACIIPRYITHYHYITRDINNAKDVGVRVRNIIISLLYAREVLYLYVSGVLYYIMSFLGGVRECGKNVAAAE